MLAYEIENRMLAILKEMDGAYREQEQYEAMHQEAQEAYELLRANILLNKKALNAKLTGSELEALQVQGAHEKRMEVIGKLALSKRAKHDAEKLEKELMAMQVLMSVVKAEMGRVSLNP